jgi:hypothetical protein
MKKLFLRAEFGSLWEPWEEDEVGRKTFFENPQGGGCTWAKSKEEEIRKFRLDADKKRDKKSGNSI